MASQNPNLKVFDETNDMLTRIIQSQKPGNDLIQNCDLPPPRRKNMRGDETNNVGVMKALQLSQTRAREAEAKWVSIGKEMDSLVVALVEDSMRVYGYRQVVRLLEFQVSQLHKQQKKLCDCCEDGSGPHLNEESSNDLIWMMGLALCLGVAGIGFAIGCKYQLL